MHSHPSYSREAIADLCQTYPLIDTLMALQPTNWFNPERKPVEQALPAVGLTASDVADASQRLTRFARYFCAAFPETASSSGLLESPVQAIPAMQQALAERYDQPIAGSLLLKLDNQLPISGSIKARGGIYEVLQHAEKLALKAGLLHLDDDYARLHSEEFREFFGRYSIAVGSTGNLGLSIGIISAKLGFKASVHMSADARQWKKDMLRSHGVNVVEYESDYSVAVAQGRAEAEQDPNCHFVDDENSVQLFLGYAVAGERLKAQLEQQHIKVDKEHPLFVYLPCGVGGGPGGVAFGLKLAFGDAVHCIFAEPTHSPCMLLGVYTGLHDHISVQDLGIDNRTAADGLAVGRASGFVGRTMAPMLDGFYTLSDADMLELLGLLNEQENIRLEPSALAGMPGPVRMLSETEGYRQRQGLTPARLARANHLVWATGGGMVPEPEMARYLAQAASAKPAAV
ncbi:D-serine ammonia-lyase [Oceanisphaera arctica]|uniref:Probable D-serine dehydratase n=1 Tax=Oceanisphaera arctica TaxID=641510 RepID=A0A2P5TIV4_9GAMM|nr:D-serine ammonia-lyase [Oceanisphaera arctica]PPL14790.1 D-serine ammonia-lyase [Oceanisphaera arctica]GHA20708.1 D-serine dehydratase [Oceanisphaera arctica]